MRLIQHIAFVASVAGSTALPPRPAGPTRAAKPSRRAAPSQLRIIDGITFAVEPGTVYLPPGELRARLGFPVKAEEGSTQVTVGGATVSRSATRVLLNGGVVVALRSLADHGLASRWDKTRGCVVVAYRNKKLGVRDGVKRVAVNRSTQTMRVWQGRRLLGETNVSTGRSGFSTPKGRYTAGPFKAVMHHSALYNDAPMPFTVQVIGNVCIHGSGSVPRYPASHGCIRMPLTGNNPARWFFEWVDLGNPVMIRDEWPRLRFGA